jgi:(p)ppGpp synthase/HD superfamily hydrolase
MHGGHHTGGEGDCPKRPSRQRILSILMLTHRFDEAAAFAIELHRAQTRKGTAIPYVTHLFGVCSLVLEDGGDEEDAIAALLHDGPEDQGGRPVLAAIEARFGERVASTVAELSDGMPAPGESKLPWRERKETYLRHLAVASASVLRVSLADKLHNARSILVDRGVLGEAVWERFNAPRDEQAWYFERLLAIFRQRLPGSRNLPELARVVGELFPPG